MPQETVNKLSEFRLQRKPTITSGDLASSTDSPENKSTPRRRIIEIHDSDSDCEVTETENSVTTAQPATMEAPPSTPIKSPPPASTNTVITTILPENKEKNEVVVQKELKVRYLIKMFAGVEAFDIYQVLSDFNFDIVKSVKRLCDKHKKTVEVDFDTWREANVSLNKTEETDSSNNLYKNIKIDSVVSLAKEVSTSSDNSSAKDVSTSSNNSFVSNTPTVNNVPNMSIKRRETLEDLYSKAKKQKIEDKNDDSNGSTKDHYQNNKVFDSDDDSDVEISNDLTADKKRVLEFMQTATANELHLMPSCSKRKVDILIACRPFNDWIDLVTKLQENRSLSTDLLNAAQQVLTTRNNMKVLLKKCANLSQKLEFAISNDTSVKEQPKLLSPSTRLTSYQMVGLNWLRVLHHSDVNGILADEMGLGKTVQVIAFLAHLKEINEAKNTHLIVVPSSTLENWQNEFQKWCPDIKVLLYYGSLEERRSLRAIFSSGRHKEYDVILTTYTMVSSNSEEKKMFRITPMHYVIFDEAHMLKNMNTQRYESLIRIKAAKRILLTGTPLQNNLLELMSLLIFVMPNIFSEKTEDLKNLFQKTSRSKDAENDLLPEFERDQIQHAKRIMKPFVLRRLKKDVLQDLPKKDDFMLEVSMAPTQEEHYINLVASFKEAGNSDTVSYNGVTMMSDLRKLSNHPLLLRYHYQYEDLPSIAARLAIDPGYKDTVEQYIIDDLACMSDFEIHTMSKEFQCLEDFRLPDNLILTSGKFLFLDKKLKELKHEGHRVLIFSQYVIMLDVMEEYLQLRDHTYLRLDGSTPVNIRQQLIDEYNEDSGIFIFLLSTKAGGLGINLTSADTVIIHDIDFNPYNDKQAEDRCHRMGQQNPVTVYRLISKGTIEEGMWQLTQEKLKLEKEITSEDYENTDVKSVVNLLSSALGIDTVKATNLVSPKKKS